jgi:hypothetical protein
LGHTGLQKDLPQTSGFPPDVAILQPNGACDCKQFNFGRPSHLSLDGETTMAEGRPVLTQINIIAGDLRRSLDFYRQVGMSFPRPLENRTG